jgi:hypothetical protein
MIERILKHVCSAEYGNIPQNLWLGTGARVSEVYGEAHLDFYKQLQKLLSDRFHVDFENFHSLGCGMGYDIACCSILFNTVHQFLGHEIDFKRAAVLEQTATLLNSHFRYSSSYGHNASRVDFRQGDISDYKYKGSCIFFVHNEKFDHENLNGRLAMWIDGSGGENLTNGSLIICLGKAIPLNSIRWEKNEYIILCSPKDLVTYGGKQLNLFIYRLGCNPQTKPMRYPSRRLTEKLDWT